MTEPAPTARSWYFYHYGLQLAVCVVWYMAFHAAYFSIPDSIFRDILYYRGLGTVSAELIRWFSPFEGVLAVQNHLLSSRADLEIIRGCDGAGALFLIVAAILAFPANFKRKLLGLGVGILLMYALNLSRIIGLYFIIAYRRDWFDLVHTYLAPTLIIVLACLYFAWWAFGSSPSNHVPP